MYNVLAVPVIGPTIISVFFAIKEKFKLFCYIIKKNT